MDIYQRRRLVALSILAGFFVIIVLLIRSCGDDEEAPITALGASGASGASGVAGATSLSQADYADQADATCLESNTALAAVDTADPTEAATERGQIVAGQLESLQTLPPPTEGEEDLQRFLSALQDQASAYDEQITAIERGDDAASAEIEALIDEAAAEARKAARAFGFEVCGDPSQVGGSTNGEGDATATDSAGGVEPVVPTAPTEPAPPPVPTTPEAPVPAAPADGGGATPAPAPAPPADDSGSGGVSP